MLEFRFVLTALRDSNGVKMLDHPNYETWKQTLVALHHDEKHVYLLKEGLSFLYCEKIADKGVPQDKIIAIFMLLFID